MRRGPDSEAVARNLEIEPETTGLAIEVVAAEAFDHDDLLAGLAPLWSRVVEAAANRTRRISRDGVA